MRIFVTWLLAFGMIVSPAMAGTDGAGDAKNTTASNTTNTTTVRRRIRLRTPRRLRQRQMQQSRRLRAWRANCSNSGILSRLNPSCCKRKANN